MSRVRIEVLTEAHLQDVKDYIESGIGPVVRLEPVDKRTHKKREVREMALVGMCCAGINASLIGGILTGQWVYFVFTVSLVGLLGIHIW